jgi:hypothetical protein
MKLGILVVYLVAEEDERLLEIHLSQIEKTTSVPFRIYAAANRLLPRFREKIERLSYVSICQIPTTKLRDSFEHAHYLDRLVEIAVADGATFICTFHVDSFPVCAGWVEKIAAEMREDCVLAGVERDERKDRKPVTEFMIFTREFYVAHRPTFRLTESEMASSEYPKYLANCPHTPDSGLGYGFKLWSQGLSWFPLKRLHNDRAPSTGGLYGDLIFHLGGMVRNRSARKDVTSPKISAAHLLSLFRAFGRAVVPSKLWRRFNRMNAIQRWAEAHWARPLRGRVFLETGDAVLFRETRDALLADPEEFLHRLRDTPRGEAEVSRNSKSGTIT